VVVSKGKDSQVKLVVDPYGEATGLSLPSMEADVVLVTHDHEDHNNKKAVKGEPFVIVNPGEYEVKGVFIQGIPSFHDDVLGKERGQNTIYTLEGEGIKVCHLGDFGQKELTPQQLESIGDVDILLIPVGGVYTINGKEAQKVISQLEPKIVIPMHYALPKLKYKLNPVDDFLHTMGAKKVEAQEKLVVKEKDLAQDREETEIVVLHL
jgi:L-ascorbate metabolism protein UlaG (beta-lactamase superfamily)